MCHENKMGAAKEQHPYIICRLDKQKWWNSSGTVTRPLFKAISCHAFCTMFVCFLTKQYGQILLTAMESYPFFI